MAFAQNQGVVSVMQMFPDVSRQSIEDDLRRTRNVQLTIENILQGRIAVQPPSPLSVSSLGLCWTCTLMLSLSFRLFSKKKRGTNPNPVPVPAQQPSNSNSQPSAMASAFPGDLPRMAEPSKKWSPDPDARTSEFLQKKHFIFQQARE